MTWIIRSLVFVGGAAIGSLLWTLRERNFANVEVHDEIVDAGGFPLKEVPSVAMLFQIRRQITTSTIWERWYRDAFDWIYAQGLEDPLITPSERSLILRSYVNYSPAFKKEAVQEFMPPSLAQSLIPGPTECVWSNLNPCNYRLFLEAYTEFPEAQYFILVSHNSMPLKPFSHIFEALKKDRRIRTTLVKPHFAESLPKTSTWRGEPRELVERRLWDSNWTNGYWLSDATQGCGPDECVIWKPLVDQYGDAAETKFVLSHCESHMSCFMFDCWPNKKECRKSGESRSISPYDWSSLNESFIRRLLEDPDRWFLRKVEDSIPVKPTNLTLADYWAKFSKSAYADLVVPPHPHLNDHWPQARGADIYALREMYKKANLYGLREGL